MQATSLEIPTKPHTDGRRTTPEQKKANKIARGVRYRAKHPNTYRDWAAKNAGKLRIYKREAAGYPAATRPEPSVCECCGRKPGPRGLHLDHCHTTGEFRGWLCSPCNRGMGMLGDDIPGLTKAVDYLKRFYT